ERNAMPAGYALVQKSWTWRSVSREMTSTPYGTKELKYMARAGQLTMRLSGSPWLWLSLAIRVGSSVAMEYRNSQTGEERRWTRSSLPSGLTSRRASNGPYGWRELITAPVVSFTIRTMPAPASLT